MCVLVGLVGGLHVSPLGVEDGLLDSPQGVPEGVLVSLQGVLVGALVSPEGLLDGVLVLSEGVLEGILVWPEGVPGGATASSGRELLVSSEGVLIASYELVVPHSFSSGGFDGLGRLPASARALAFFQRDAFAIRERRLNSEM